MGIKAVVFATVFFPFAWAAALLPFSNRPRTWIAPAAILGALALLGLTATLAAYSARRDVGDSTTVRTNVSPWSWGEKGPTLHLAFRIDRREAWLLPMIGAILFSAVAATASGERTDAARIAAHFGVAGAAIGALLADDLLLAVLFTAGATAAAWLMLNGAASSVSFSILARLLAIDALLLTPTLSDAAGAPLSGGGLSLMLIATAAGAAVFPLHGWLPQILRTVGVDGAAVCVLLPWTILMLGLRVAPSLPPPIGVFLAAAAVLAALTSLAEPNLAARLGYLYSSSVSLAAAQLFRVGEQGAGPAWLHLAVSSLAAAGLIGSVASQTWRGDRWSLLLLAVWSASPAFLLTVRPLGALQSGNLDGLALLLSQIGAWIAAVSLMRLAAAAPKTAPARSRIVTIARIVLLLAVVWATASTFMGFLQEPAGTEG